jgi:hypothetical protein
MKQLTDEQRQRLSDIFTFHRACRISHSINPLEFIMSALDRAVHDGKLNRSAAEDIFEAVLDDLFPPLWNDNWRVVED